MINIRIIAIGKIKERYITQGISEYLKRLTRYCKMEIIEIADDRIPEKAGGKEEDEVRRKEGEKILRAIKKDSYFIALCIEGILLDSIQLSNNIGELAAGGKSDITFIIGGSLGLSEEIKKMVDFRLSFSKMTFPHQLMRLILIEQIYRSLKILNGEVYHK